MKYQLPPPPRMPAIPPPPPPPPPKSGEPASAEVQREILGIVRSLDGRVSVLEARDARYTATELAAAAAAAGAVRAARKWALAGAGAAGAVAFDALWDLVPKVIAALAQ